MAKVHPTVLVVLSTAYGGERPAVDDVPRFSRWLVSQGKRGVIAANTPSSTLFAYPASYADDGNGVTLFYFSRFDPVGMDGNGVTLLKYRSSRGSSNSACQRKNIPSS